MVEYKLTVTDTQLKLIWAALEEYERLRMGQFSDFVNDVALNGYVYDESNPDNSRLFDEYIRRRNDSQELFYQAYRIAAPKITRKTEDMLIAEDMWTAIWHHLYMERPAEERRRYNTASFPPLHYGSEPRIKIERGQA